MALKFSEFPGRAERDCQRRNDNRLFDKSLRHVTQRQLSEATRADATEVSEFAQAFQKLFDDTSGLDSNVESDVILELKSRADRLYEQATGLSGDHGKYKTALLKLVEVMMTSVRAGAGDDAHALSELEQEQEARSIHVSLLVYPIVSDMLRPDSLITAETLTPTLLSISDDELTAILHLFEEEQLAFIHNEALQLLTRCRDEGYDYPEAWARLQYIADVV